MPKQETLKQILRLLRKGDMLSYLNAFFFVALLVFTQSSPAATKAKASTENEAETQAQLKAYQRQSQKASPQKLVEMVNEGWGDFYEQARTDLDPKKSYVAIHAWDPGMVMDLRSADGFRATLLSRGLLKVEEFSIGHTWIAWRCQTSSGKILEGAAGQTGESENQAAQMLKSGWGLSSFKSTFSDGLIQWPELLEWSADGEEGNLHTLFVEVDSKTCLRTAQFVKTYITHPKQPRKYFGLEPNPAKFEGGGCGSFGIVAATQGGIFGSVDLTSKMWRTVYARDDLFGRGTELPADTRPYLNPKVTQNREVDLFNPVPFMGPDILFSNWNGNPATSPKLRILDPELLLMSIRQVYRLKYNDLARSNPELASKFLGSKSKAYAYRVFDSPEFSESPRMREYRLRNGGRADELKFDQSLDSQAQQIINLTRFWMSSGNFKARLTSVNEGHPAVILERR